jgi:hypothetical protein
MPDCACCFTPAICCPPAPVAADASAKEEDDNEVPMTAIGRILTPILTTPIGKVMIPIVFFSWAAVNTSMMLKNGTGLTVTDVVPDDSYIVDLVETSDEFWDGAYRGMELVFVGDFYADEAKVAKMCVLRAKRAQRRSVLLRRKRAAERSRRAQRTWVLLRRKRAAERSRRAQRRCVLLR